MLKTCFAIVLTLVTLLPLAAAAAAECPAYIEPRITVAPIDAPPVYDDKESLAAIARLAGESRRSPSGALEIPVGLTASSLMLKSAYEIASEGFPGEPVCVHISRLNFAFGFDDTTVYIAREVPRNSCAYQQVLAHERRHVQADHDLMQYYLPLLKTALGDAIRATGTIRAATPDIAEQRFRAIMDGYTHELATRLSAERARQQQRIDTPEEYERISRACNGAISSLVSQR